MWRMPNGSTAGLNMHPDSDDEVWLDPEEETRTQASVIHVTQVRYPLSRPTLPDSAKMNREITEAVVLPKRYLEMCTQAAKRRSRAASDDQRPLHDIPTRPTHALPRSFLVSGTKSTTRKGTKTDSSKTKGNYILKDGEAERYKDLNTAISWLRQEIANLKQQDKILLRQFLELRSMIHKLRAHPRSSSCSSSNDVSVHASTAHLNMLPVDERGELGNGSKSNSLLREECAVEFRDRTMSMLTTRDVYRQNSRRKAKECL